MGQLGLWADQDSKDASAPLLPGGRRHSGLAVWRCRRFGEELRAGQY